MGLLRIFLLSTCMFLLSHANLDDIQGASDEDKAEYIFECMDAILCVAREKREYRNMLAACGDEVLAEAMGNFKTINGFEGATDSDEFWDGYPDLKCSFDKDQRKAWFDEWLIWLSEKWMACCDDENEEDPSNLDEDGCCYGMGEGEKNMNERLTYYIEQGVCEHPEEYAKRKMEERRAESLPFGG